MGELIVGAEEALEPGGELGGDAGLVLPVARKALISEGFRMESLSLDLNWRCVCGF